MFVFVFDESLFAFVYDTPPFVFVPLYERAKTRPERVHPSTIKNVCFSSFCVVWLSVNATKVMISKNLRGISEPLKTKKKSIGFADIPIKALEVL